MAIFKKTDYSESDLDRDRIPRHIGIIMDGNGRWAKRRMLPRSAGHKAGAKKLDQICEYCAELGVEALTAYAFSTENWSRSKDEVDALMDLLYNYLQDVEEKFTQRNMRLQISGDIEPLSQKIKDAIARAEEVTASGERMVLNIALNYGGRDEIVRAARMAAQSVKDGEISVEDIDEKYMNGLMYTSNLPEVDLIIRPSGELRLSNFLLWQAAYAEFWFSDICWPDFSERDMLKAVLDYQNRDRRFGNVN